MPKAPQYSPEFRSAAVDEVLAKSRPVADVAAELKISPQALYAWIKSRKEGHGGVPDELSLPERIELAELRRQNKDLREENEFLGKSVAFFARKPR